LITDLYFGILAGIFLFTISIHIQIATKSSWPREERFFLGNSVAAFAYTAITWLQYNTDGVEAYMRLNLVQSFSWVAFFICLAEFMAGPEVKKRALRVWEAIFASFTVICAFFPYGGAYFRVRGMKPVDLPWGESVNLIDGDGTPTYFLALAFILVGMAIAGRGLLRRAKLKEGRASRLLAVSLGILLAAIAFDVAVAVNLVHWFYLSETSYVTFTLITGFAITERAIKVAGLEKALGRSVADKDILIKEIHHRVRNNLAVLSSLVRLQLSSEVEARVRRRLGTTLNRIRSIAGVHDLAYDPLGAAEIDLGCYLEGILRSVTETFGDGAIEVDSLVEPAGLRLPVDLAVPLGLIANEIFANSVLHAWEGAGERRISYRAALEGKHLGLSIADNGKGWRDGAGPMGLGGKLIRALAEQIEARVVKEAALGTAWTIELDLDKERALASL
jgi:two-component sensor histidine kinase